MRRDSQSRSRGYLLSYAHESKRFDIKLHFLREVTSTGSVKQVKVSTQENLVDVLTKVAPQHLKQIKLMFLKTEFIEII